MEQSDQEVELDLSDQNLTNEKLAQILHEYPKLTRLDLMSNQKLTDISPISKFVELKHLNISDTAVADLTPLKGLTNLKSFLADDANKISDISPLSDSTGLEILILTNTQVDNSALRVLKCFTDLRDLSLVNTKISGDISELKLLTKLECLCLYEIDFDAASLLELTTLKMLQLLNVDPEYEGTKNRLISILPNLKNRQIRSAVYTYLHNITLILNNIDLEIQNGCVDAEQKAYIDSRLLSMIQKIQNLQLITQARDIQEDLNSKSSVELSDTSAGLNNKELMTEIMRLLRYLDSQLQSLEYNLKAVIFEADYMKLLCSDLESLLEKIRHIQSVCKSHESQYESDRAISVSILK